MSIDDANPADWDNLNRKYLRQTVAPTDDAPPNASRSDGSTASYYQLPNRATELQHLISDKNMNAQIGEIFRSCYRYGEASHSNQLRDAKKIKFYIDAEIERLSGGN